MFQGEDGIRELVRSRGLGDVYKRQEGAGLAGGDVHQAVDLLAHGVHRERPHLRLELEGAVEAEGCLLYTSDAADERSSVDLGGRRIIKKKKTITQSRGRITTTYT